MSLSESIKNVKHNFADKGGNYDKPQKGNRLAIAKANTSYAGIALIKGDQRVLALKSTKLSFSGYEPLRSIGIGQYTLKMIQAVLILKRELINRSGV
jgi:hypothetical protein